MVMRTAEFTHELLALAPRENSTSAELDTDML